jgi:LacI family transcriptional regulator
VLDLAGRVDGMAIMGRTVDDDVVAQIADGGLPLVLLARPPVRAVDTITTDNDRSAWELVRHLLAHGYRRFAYVGSPNESPDVAGRYAAFCRCLDAADVEPQRPVGCAFDVAAGYAAARRVLAGRRRPEAFVCANYEIALGVLEAAAEAGLAVPGDVAVTGWDDVMAARYAGLTTVRQPMRVLGATAATWLQERITGSRGPVRREVLRTQFVIRSSCGVHDAVEVEE